MNRRIFLPFPSHRSSFVACRMMGVPENPWTGNKWRAPRRRRRAIYQLRGSTDYEPTANHPSGPVSGVEWKGQNGRNFYCVLELNGATRPGAVVIVKKYCQSSMLRCRHRRMDGGVLRPSPVAGCRNSGRPFFSAPTWGRNSTMRDAKAAVSPIGIFYIVFIWGNGEIGNRMERDDSQLCMEYSTHTTMRRWGIHSLAGNQPGMIISLNLG